MMKFIDDLPYGILIIASVFMFLAPFYPMPHVVEKILMLKNGTLKRPIDIFDLFFHLIPAILLLIKVVRENIQ